MSCTLSVNFIVKLCPKSSSVAVGYNENELKFHMHILYIQSGNDYVQLKISGDLITSERKVTTRKKWEKNK